jgi:hypothetical protein
VFVERAVKDALPTPDRRSRNPAVSISVGRSRGEAAAAPVRFVLCPLRSPEASRWYEF